MSSRFEDATGAIYCANRLQGPSPRADIFRVRTLEPRSLQPHELPAAPRPPPQPGDVAVDAPRSERGGLAASITVLILGIGFAPMFTGPSWPMRAAVLIVLAAACPFLLWGLVGTSRRTASLFGAAFVGWAALATAMSSNPILSLTGLWGWGTGLVFVAGLIGAWALGAGAATWKAKIEAVVVVVVVINVMVGIVQALGVAQGDAIEAISNRISGLSGSSVQLAALVSGGIALLVSRTRSERWVPSAVLAGACAIVLPLTGSRFGLVAIALIAIAQFRRNDVKRAAVVAAIVMLGTALGAVFPNSGVTTATERLSSSSGIELRVENWKIASDAVLASPIVGHGPGLYRDAVGPHRTAAVAKAASSDVVFADAHNIVVEYGVATGIVGLLLAGLWLGRASQGTRGPLLWFALAIAGFQMVQPQSVATTPLAFLALGAAGPALVVSAGRLRRVLTAVAITAGVAVAAVFLMGEFRLYNASLDFTLDDALEAEQILGHWPQPAQVLGRIHLLGAIEQSDPALKTIGLDWYRHAAEADPNDSAWWSRLAEAEAAAQLPVEATADFERALEIDPWSQRALVGLARLSLAQGERDAAVELAERARVVRPHPAVDELLNLLAAAP